MFGTLKRWLGFGDEEAQLTQKTLSALPPDELERRVQETREALIKEFKLKIKPGQLICGIVGLENLGNTCFMASALQCLINTRALTVHFLSTDWEEELNGVSSPARGRLACEYYTLLRKVWCEQKDFVSPGNVKNAITRVSKTFAGYSQQDSQEFLAFFLDALHEDLNAIVVRPYTAVKDYAGEPVEDFGRSLFQSHLSRNRSFVVDTFHGQFYSKLQCPDCQFVSASCDPFDMISMTIQSQDKRLCEGYLVGFTHDLPIREFKFNCNETEPLVKVVGHICGAAGALDQRFIQPMFYLRSKIIEKAPAPYSLSVKAAMDNEGIMFLCQVYDPTTMRLVFGERAAEAEAQFQPGASLDYCLRVLIFENDQMIGIEREVVVPERTTPLDLHLLIYAIYRAAFITAETKDGEHLEAAPPATREQLLKEFRIFWPDNDIEIRRALFVVKLNGKQLISLEETSWLFKHTFESRLTVEVHLNPKKFLNSLKLKKCLRLEVPNLLSVEKPLTLASCFEGFTSEERLDKDNMWYCPRCKEPKQAFKKMSLLRLPEVLIIHLKRFKKELYKNHFLSYKKNTAFVDFPLRAFDVAPFAFGDQSDTKYNLYGVSNHYGGVGGGHYTAFCKNFLHKKWYCFDDTDVSAQDESEIVTDAAYVLFYHRLRNV